MLQALLHGKMSPEEEGAEDLLTASVFGLLSYLPERENLAEFLSLAERADGARDPFFASKALRLATFEFWPTYNLPHVRIDGAGRSDLGRRRRETHTHTHRFD